MPRQIVQASPRIPTAAVAWDGGAAVARTARQNAPAAAAAWPSLSFPARGGAFAIRSAAGASCQLARVAPLEHGRPAVPRDPRGCEGAPVMRGATESPRPHGPLRGSYRPESPESVLKPEGTALALCRSGRAHDALAIPSRRRDAPGTKNVPQADRRARWPPPSRKINEAHAGAAGGAFFRAVPRGGGQVSCPWPRREGALLPRGQAVPV